MTDHSTQIDRDMHCLWHFYSERYKVNSFEYNVFKDTICNLNILSGYSMYCKHTWPRHLTKINRLHLPKHTLFTLYTQVQWQHFEPELKVTDCNFKQPRSSFKLRVSIYGSVNIPMFCTSVINDVIDTRQCQSESLFSETIYETTPFVFRPYWSRVSLQFPGLTGIKHIL